MFKNTFLIITIINFFLSFLLLLKDKDQILKFEIIEVQIDSLITPDKRKGAAIR